MNERPEITISTLDLERLNNLIDKSPESPVVLALEEELVRANEVAPADMPADIVTMNSTVKFMIESTGKEFEMTLVYPKDADTSGKTLSILTPIGSALLGLHEGDQIEWPKPGGAMQTVKIIEVLYQPERAGELHR